VEIADYRFMVRKGVELKLHPYIFDSKTVLIFQSHGGEPLLKR